MAEETAITLPVLHLNGTGGQTLEEDYGHAWSVLHDFEDALQKVEFNRRDYYCHPDPQAWAKACEQRREIFDKINEIRAYLDAHREHIFENWKH